MNRMKDEGITQLRYLFDVYVYFITIILLKPRVDFLVSIISGKKYGTKGYKPMKLKLSTVIERC